MRGRRAAAVAATIALTAAGAGCAAESEGDGAASGRSSAAAGGGPTAAGQTAILRFTACMRDQGIDLPDPSGGDGGIVQIGGGDFDPGDPAFQRANRRCSKYLAQARPQVPPDEQGEMQAKVLKFVRCLREHGVDVPDSVAQGGALRLGPGGIDPEDPAFKRAEKSCGNPLVPSGG